MVYLERPATLGSLEGGAQRIALGGMELELVPAEPLQIHHTYRVA